MDYQLHQKYSNEHTIYVTEKYSYSTVVRSFQPSAKIRDAWKVINHLNDWEKKTLVWHEKDNVWGFVIGNEHSSFYGEHSSPSMAICIAVLRTVGINLNNETIHQGGYQ